MAEREPVGRRERKKAAVRRTISDTALRLFLEHGYDAVGVREIADAADVSVSTLFNHFPDGKEALVFDESTENESALTRAVMKRTAGQSIPHALRDHFLDFVDSANTRDARFTAYQRLIQETPELRAYSRALWMRQEHALAAALAHETGRPADDPLCAAYARFTLEVLPFARPYENPRVAITQAFAVLDRGWAAFGG